MSIKLHKALLLVGLMLVSFSVMAKEPSYQNVLLTKWKMADSVDYESVVDDYMRTYRSDVWDRYKNDEFELAAKRQETIDLMKEKVESVDLSDPFFITTSADFGEYNFEKNEYSFSPLEASTYFPIRSYSNYFSTIRLSIENGNQINGIPMPVEEAKKFLNSRKNRYGSVDRSVRMTLTLMPVSVDSRSLMTRIVKYEVQGEDGNILLENDFQES